MAYMFAIISAYVITLLDLWSSGYRRTFSFLIKCPSAHVLASVYAVVAAGLVVLFDIFVAPSLVAANEESPWLAQVLDYLRATPIAQGLFIGLFANGLANLRLFNVPVAQGVVPIGPQTLTMMFDEPLREGAFLQHFNRVKQFAIDHLADIGKGDADLPILIADAQSGVPANFPIDRKSAIKADFADSARAVDLIQKATERFGVEWVRSTLK